MITRKKKETVYYLNIYHFPWDVKQNKPYSYGIQSQFIVDSGADVSIMNYETFEAIRKIQPNTQIMKPDKPLIAANAIPIEILGITRITCSYDSEGKYQFSHTFYITTRKGGKLNLIGTDIINKQFKLWDFQDTSVTLKDHERKIYLLKTAEKQYPYYAKIYALQNKNKIQIPALMARIIKIEKPNIMKRIKENTSLEINEKTAKTNLIFYEVSTTQVENKFPVLIENILNHPITLTEGNIGFLTRDAKSKLPRYRIKNTENFANSIIVNYLSREIQKENAEEDYKKGNSEKMANKKENIVKEKTIIKNNGQSPFRSDKMSWENKNSFQSGKNPWNSKTGNLNQDKSPFRSDKMSWENTNSFRSGKEPWNSTKLNINQDKTPFRSDKMSWENTNSFRSGYEFISIRQRTVEFD